MSEVAIIDPVKDKRWDKFVENHPFGWICHLSDWNQVLEKSFKHMKGHYLALLDNNEIQSALPFYEVRSWLTGNRLVSIPFATLSDPLISKPDDMKKLFEAALSLSRELKIPRLEIRTLDSHELIQDARLDRHSYYKHHFMHLDAAPEKLKRSFDRTCVRQRISRSMQSNLNLKVADNESDVKSFYRLYLMTRKRLSLPLQPYFFIKMLWETFSPLKRMEILLAKQRDRAIAGVILFKFKDRVSIEFSAHDESYRNVSAIHFLFWEAIKSAYNKGYKILDFGRTSPKNKGLMDFKKRWGTKVVDIPHFYYPKEASQRNGNRESSMSYKAVKKMCNKAPDFVLPYIGSFCYRHLG